jgi:aspartyl-tRNA(Asn)/glutamyl-tRNA(Gln) amidotransferase subunit C
MISKETIQHLAKLARIELSPEREEQLAVDVAKILAYVDDLKNVNTDDLPEISQVTGLKNALREDLPTDEVLATPEEILKTAPMTENGFVKVRAIFE